MTIRTCPSWFNDDKDLSVLVLLYTHQFKRVRQLFTMIAITLLPVQKGLLQMISHHSDHTMYT